MSRRRSGKIRTTVMSTPQRAAYNGGFCEVIERSPGIRETRQDARRWLSDIKRAKGKHCTRRLALSSSRVGDNTHLENTSTC